MHHKVKVKIPLFDPSRDKMDNYLVRFERLATDLNMTENEKLLNLVSQLTGKALEVYTQMGDEGHVTYEQLKDELIRTFGMSIEEARKKFRHAALWGDETAGQFADRLTVCLKKWWKLNGTTQDLKGLQDLVVREQFFQSCPMDLKSFLTQKRINNLKEVVEETTSWFNAYDHPAYKSTQHVKPENFRESDFKSEQLKDAYSKTGNKEYSQKVDNYKKPYIFKKYQKGAAATMNTETE